jgi:hypothetical protein
LKDLGPHPGLVKEFDGGQEIIHEGAEGPVDSGEALKFGGGVETAAADIAADTLQVFLFNETVVVFLAGPGPGKGDLVSIAPGTEGMVDKLGAVIAIDA